MDSKSVLRIEPMHSGFVVFKDGGTAAFAYACTGLADVHRLIDETYIEPQQTENRLLPPHTEALIQRTQDDDTVPGLNAGSAP